MIQQQNKKIRNNKEWQILVEEYKKSGLSKAKFCKQQNIHKGTFYIWSKAFAVNKKNIEESKFIPITVKDCEKERDDEIKSALLLESRDGLKVEFKNGCKISDIKAIAEVLRC